MTVGRVRVDFRLGLLSALLGCLCLTSTALAQQDYPSAIWSAASSNNYDVASRAASDVTWIVIHTTDGTCSSARSHFQDSTSLVSAHYVICRDGTVYQMVRNKDIAFHAGNYSYNAHSIGIEHEQYSSLGITDAQYQASVALVEWLVARYAIPIKYHDPPTTLVPCDGSTDGGIIGHRQVRKPSDCTGVARVDPVNWDWPYYQQLLAGGGNTAPDRPTNVSPVDGATVHTLTPTLQCSPFSDPDGNSHEESWWEVRPCSDNSYLWDSGWRTFDLTSTTVDPGYLQWNTCYRWKCRYADDGADIDGQRPWSQPAPIATSFYTAQDLCAGKTCTALDQCHNAGTCDPATGNCSNPSKSNGSSCNDGQFCNGTDTCNSGSCGVHAGNPCPGADGDSDCSETCNEAADNCTTNDPNGSSCDDGNPSTINDQCTNGLCLSDQFCPQYDVGGTVPDTLLGTTVGQPDLMSGASCGTGGSAAPDVTYRWTAPTSDTYRFDTAGSGFDTILYVREANCAGNELACDDNSGPGSNSAVTLQIAMGQTVAIVVDGSSGSSGSFSLNIARVAELCSGVTCTALDQCHDVGTCDPGTGRCSNPSKPNGSPCNDGHFCNGADTCNSGTCGAHTGNPCPGADGDSDCSETCNEAAGNCTTNDPNGSSCDDGNPDTANDQCTNGICGGAQDLCTGKTCTALDQCHNPGTCDPGTGNCSNPTKSNGTACNDSQFCNGADTCTSGSCSQHAGDPCPGPDGDADCSETCNEVADDCSIDDPNGSLCDDGNPDTTNDHCTNGNCGSNADLCGDANGDGKVTAADALTTLRTAVGVGACDLARCDYNGSGDVTAADALAVLRAAVGSQTAPNCQGLAAYDIVFQLDTAVTLGALALRVDYGSAAGEFAGNGALVNCTNLIGGEVLAAIVDHDDTSILAASFITLGTKLTGPDKHVARCRFQSVAPPPRATDFGIQIVTADDLDVKPVANVEVSIASITPATQRATARVSGPIDSTTTLGPATSSTASDPVDR